MKWKTATFKRGKLFYRVPQGNMTPSNELHTMEHKFKAPLWVFHSLKDYEVMKDYARSKKATRVNVYRARRQLTLFRLDDASNVKRMANLKVPGTTGKSPGVYVLRNKVYRNSSISRDIKFLKWICKNGFDGYTAGPTKVANDKSGYFHLETAICSPSAVAPVEQRPISSLL